MSDTTQERYIRILEQIRDNQNKALELQRRQFDLLKEHYERAQRLQDRAEQIQERSAQIMGSARKAVMIILPIIIALIAYLTWLIFI